MRRRTNHVLAVFGFVVVALLALAFHPEFNAGAATGMSAPSAPRTSIEPAPIDKLLPSHFDWCEPVLRTAGLPLALPVYRAGESSEKDARSARYYGPLHQRPPPSLS